MVKHGADVRAIKKAMRRDILTRRDQLTDVAQKKAGTLIAERILEHPWYDAADVILGFASYGSEIETDAILLDALRRGKKLYLPRILGDEMLFFRVYDLRKLQTGYKGIREPVENGERFGYPLQEKNILMLMPGVAFDAKRGRMGYGKGFYDRFLADKPDLACRTIGIGHACQLVDTVPFEETDIRPAQVICV